MSGSNYPPGWYHLHDRPGHARYFDGTQLVGPAKQPPEGWTDAAGYTLRQGRLVHASDTAAGGKVASGRPTSGGTLLGRLKSDRIMQVAAVGVVMMAVGVLMAVAGLFTGGTPAGPDDTPTTDPQTMPADNQPAADQGNQQAQGSEGQLPEAPAAELPEIAVVTETPEQPGLDQYIAASLPGPSDLSGRFEAGLSGMSEGAPCPLIDAQHVSQWAQARDIDAAPATYDYTDSYDYTEDTLQSVSCSIPVGEHEVLLSGTRIVDKSGVTIPERTRPQANAWAIQTIFSVGEHYVAVDVEDLRVETHDADAQVAVDVSALGHPSLTAEDLVALVAVMSE